MEHTPLQLEDHPPPRSSVGRVSLNGLSELEQTYVFFYEGIYTSQIGNLLNNEPNGKVLEKGEITKLKKLFYAFDKNIITSGLSELIGWDDILNNENDNEYINIEKIMPNDDILKNDFSFKDEE